MLTTIPWVSPAAPLFQRKSNMNNPKNITEFMARSLLVRLHNNDQQEIARLKAQVEQLKINEFHDSCDSCGTLLCDKCDEHSISNIGMYNKSKYCETCSSRHCEMCGKPADNNYCHNPECDIGTCEECTQRSECSTCRAFIQTCDTVCQGYVYNKCDVCQADTCVWCHSVYGTCPDCM
jgi:hypothetical protein